VREFKTHFGHDSRSLCHTDGRTTAYEPDVTCRRCQYHLGLYVPLSRLREHQAAQRMRAEAWHSKTVTVVKLAVVSDMGVFEI
jgi:hypothetical protein